MAGSSADPGKVRTKGDLARELTVLRSEAGLTVRELARRLGAPIATLGDYFAGRHLPNLRQLSLYRQLLAECGVTDGAHQELWVEALNRARGASDGRATKTRPPYRGLEPLGEGDEELFFGRQAVVGELLGRIRQIRHAGPGSGESVALVGPSGSGKSSLLMAGLLPALRTRPGPELAGTAARYLTPEQLTPRMVEEIRGSSGPPPVVIVDQVEEALTASSTRKPGLLQRIGELQRCATVVFGLRADFYQAAAAEAVLLPALRHNQILLGPMTAGELREAVLGPAERVGAAVEAGLVELVLADLTPGSPPGFAHDPGALPLLSYALLATWERASRNQMTVADYRSVGGLHGAVSQAAERLYGDLSEQERDTARSLFSRLVRVDGDGPPTRRRAPRSSLTETGDPDRDRRAESVLERFVAARLLTADAAAVQISHEALLRAWPRLGDWVESDRDWLHLHDQLAGAAHEWRSAAGDDSLLWSGARLATTLEHASRPGREVSRVERSFLARSVDVRDRHQRADRRRVRRTQQLLAAVAVLAAAAIVLAALALDARDSAVRTRNQALSRQVAVEARRLQPADPSLAAELALASYRISPTVDARSALVDTTAGELPTRLLGPVGPEFVASDSSDGLLAVAQSATDTVEIYNQGTNPPARLAELHLDPAGKQDYAVALSPDGRLLAAGGTGDDVQVWNLGDPARPVPLATLAGFTGTVYSLAFSPHGNRLAAADADGTVHQFGVAGPGRPVPLPVLHTPGGVAVKSVSYSPDGRQLAAAGAHGTLAVWVRADPRPELAPGAGTSNLESVSFSPGGHRVAAASRDGSVHVWSVAASGRMSTTGSPAVRASGVMYATAFSPDGAVLAAGSADGSVHLYDTRTWTVIDTLSAPNPVTSVAFGQGGHRLVTADSGGLTRLWPVPTPSTYREGGNVFSLDYTPHGRYLYVSTSGNQGTVDAWNMTHPGGPVKLGALSMPPGFGPVAGAAALSPDGRLLAAADAKPAIQLFRLTAPGRAVAIGPPMTGNKPLIEQLGFSPNGKLLASSDDGGQVRLWDVTDPSRPAPLPTLRTGNGEVLGFAISPDSRLLAAATTGDRVLLYDIARPTHPVLVSTVGGFASYAYAAAFTPDGRTLIAGSADGTVRLWNVTDPARPRRLGPPLTGPTGYIFQIAVSPHGRYLAAGSTSQSVWIWDISDPARPRLMDTLRAVQGAIFTVRFTPDSQVLTAAGSARTLYFWRYRAASAALTVCSLAGDPLTRAEWTRYVQGAGYRSICP